MSLRSLLLLCFGLSLRALPALAAAPAPHADHAGMKGEHGDGVYQRILLEIESGITDKGEITRGLDLNARVGTDETKLYIKAEASRTGSETEGPEAWLLLSRAVATFWDVQAGLAGDLRQGGEGYAVFGVNGLAPYYFETEAHVLISRRGESFLRVRQENDVLLTQRLIAQPYAELMLAAQDSKKEETAAGFTKVTAGLQCRYEFTRRFAPFVNVRYSRALGETASFDERAGRDTETAEFTAGLRLLF